MEAGRGTTPSHGSADTVEIDRLDGDASLSWLPKIALSPYFFFREITISTFSYLVSVSGRSQSGIMPNAKADVARHLGHPETKTAHPTNTAMYADTHIP